MTLNETRNLGIELERRIQITDPNTVLVSKIDTETLYSFLNEYQKQYLRQIYLSEDQFENGTRASFRTQDILRNLIKRHTSVPDAQKTSYGSNVFILDLPEDYHDYIRSVSIVEGTYKNNVKNKAVQNILVKHQDVNKLLQGAYDSNRIMRNTYSVLHLNESEPASSKLYVYTDSYTMINKIDLYYYKTPGEFSILTKTPCELPIECFDDLVNGAYILYMQKRQGVENKQEKESK